MLPTVRCITTFGILFAFAVMIVGCNGCGKKRTSEKTPVRPIVNVTNNNLDSTFTDQTIVFQDDQQRTIWSAEVKSGTAQNKDGKQFLTLNGVKSHLYKVGQEVAQVTSDTATAVMVGKTIHTNLSGHVVATESKHGQQLEAKQFTWNSQEDLIHATQFLWLGKGVKLSADQGIFTSDLTQANYRGHVRMETAGQAPHR